MQKKIPANDSIKMVNISADNALESTKNSSQKKIQHSGIDSIVTFRATDSISFFNMTKTLRMRGDSRLSYKNFNLEAEIIQLNFNETSLNASGAVDSTGKTRGYPKFSDKGDTYFGEKVAFNFKTQQGLINLGETQLGEGYYFGEKIKRASENEFFIRNGYYTTCNEPHPHYHFGSPEMKVIAQDRIFLDPLVVVVEDMPVFMLPVGLFFPNKGGRQSGLVVPSFFFSKSRGVTFEDLGVYLALSDYYDTQILTDIYSKGGYTLKNKTRWVLKDEFSGNLELQYGKTRFDPDDDYTTNWSLALNHDQSLTPQSRVTANLRFASQDFNKNTYNDISQRLTQSITSNAQYYENFDNGSSFSASYGRNQNIIDNTYSQNGRVSYSIPQLQPLRKLLSNESSLPDWLKDIALSYGVNASWVENKSALTDSTTSMKINRVISHSPSISVSPKLGYFTITPTISFSANNYFRRLKRTYNNADSTVTDSYESGFFTEYNYGIGVNLSTRLFGVFKPNIFGINAFRHTFQPTIGYSFSPDLSSSSLGFYDSYYDEKNKRNVVYSRFEADGGGIASRRKSQIITYSLLNSFEAKVAQSDTAETNIELLRLTLGGSYNFMADSLRFSDISMTYRTPSIGAFSFSGSASFTLYDEAKTLDSDGNPTSAYHRINNFLISEGKGVARLTSISLQASTSFSSEGISSGNTTGTLQTQANTHDSVSLGERFMMKMESQDTANDFWGELSPGWSRFSPPWKIGLGLNFSYSRPTLNVINRTLNLNITFSIELTHSWHIEGRGDYDFIHKELMTPSISLRKDLHCFRLDFQWYPIGYSRGFYLRFGINSSLLQDLKYEKRNSPLLR